ncbi:FkbM family methyltransferase [Methylobacterium sp. CM6247]
MFTCYAQNFEDVLLWRALKDVPNGFYIDIGAQDPRVDSVSRGFYENGWRGFSIEPTQAYADKLRADRPDERIIQAAVGTGDRDIVFFEFPETGLSTANATVAAAHKAEGYDCVETVVPILSLDRVLKDARRLDVHWLKIDVEGLEASVLESWSDCDVRPWIVVIESTEPLAQTPTHHLWEPALLDRGYQYVYFDGLNRYYVSETHADLAAFFGPGANVFDGFEISLLGRAPGAGGLREAFLSASLDAEGSRKDLAQASAERDVLIVERDRFAKAESELLAERDTLTSEIRGLASERDVLYSERDRLASERDKLASERDRLSLERDRLANDREVLASECERMGRQLDVMESQSISAQGVERMLAATRASTSWRVTAPLRVARRATRGDFTSFSRFAGRRSGIVGMKRATRSVLARGAAFLRERPALKRAAITALDLAPPFRDRLFLALQRERAELVVVQKQTYTDYALSVEPGRLNQWRTLADTPPSDGKLP